MTTLILILVLISVLIQIVNFLKQYKASEDGYYFITYVTQKCGGSPIFHQTIIKGDPVDWILKRSSEDKSIYYRLLFVNKKRAAQLYKIL